MNKNLIKSGILAVLLLPFVAFGQTPASTLPSAGLTPESKFYFLDRLGETIRELLTFSKEGKARLEISFAAERIAEIKVIFDDKGVSAPGLEIAQARLSEHLINATSIINEKKKAGDDVSSLSGELDDELEDQKDALERIFEDKKRALERKEEDLKKKLSVAQRAGDTALSNTLLAEISAVKAEKKNFEGDKEEQKKAFEKNKEKIEKEVNKKERAEKAIAEAEKKKQEVISEASKRGTTVSPDALARFDGFLAQAKELFSRGNYQGAKQLAEQAKDFLEKDGGNDGDTEDDDNNNDDEDDSDEQDQEDID